MPPASPFSLVGKRALITGAAQGIGLTLARGLGVAGARLLLNDVDGARLAGAVATLRAEGFVVSSEAFDVANETEVQAGAERLTQGEAVDILVNNAGIHRRAPLATMSLAEWQAVLNVNLTSAFLMSRAVAPAMIARRAGKILNVCSLNCEVSRPGIANYAAAKGGLKMLTRAMAVEWGPYNIQTNGLGPGYLRTELTQSLWQDSDFDRWICARTPAGRWGIPDEVVGAAVFLVSPAANFVNGQVLYVDGGLQAAL
jgi:gluconate 5-dehydrogenase